MSDSCDLTDCSPPGSSVHGISQARILECVATSFSRGLPDPGIKPSLLHCRWILYQLRYKGRCEHVLPVNWSSLWPARVERGLNFHDATPCYSMSLTAAAPNTPYSAQGHIPHSATATQWSVTCEGGEAGQRGRPTSAHTWFQGIWGQ